MLGAVSSASYLMLFWLPIPVDLALYALVVLAALTIWLAEPNVRSSWPWPDALMVAFLFSLAASIAVSADIQRSLALSSGVIPAVMLYLMTTRYIAGLDQLKILFFGLTAGALGVSAVVLFHAAFGGNAGELIDKAAIPVLVVPNDVLFLSLIAPLTLSLLAIGESRLVKAGALLSLVTTAASVAALQRACQVFQQAAPAHPDNPVTLFDRLSSQRRNGRRRHFDAPRSLVFLVHARHL